LGVAGHPHFCQGGDSTTPCGPKGWVSHRYNLFFFKKKKKKTLKLKSTIFFFQYIPLWFYTFHDVPYVVLISIRNGTLVL